MFIDFYSTMKKDKTNKLILFTSPKKKNRRMRILGARIFSKFFGGKIVSFETDVTYRALKFSIANWCMRKLILKGIWIAKSIENSIRT